MAEDIDRYKVYLVGGEGFLRQCDINRGVCNRPALLLGRQAVALVLRTLGVLAGLAIAVQAILVHPIAREVLRWLDLATRPAVLQNMEQGASTAMCVLPTHRFAVVLGRQDLGLCPRLDKKAGQGIVSSCKA